MRVSLVCVLVLFRASVCAFRVSELLVVRLSFVVKLFLLLWSFRSEFAFSCRVSNSSFRVVFWSRFSNSISRILEVVFWSRISNSSFSFRCSIRFLEFRFSIRISSSSSLIFRAEFVVEIFDVLLYSTSRISIRKFHCSIRLLEFHCSSRFLEFRVFDSSALNFEFVLIYSTSRIVVESFVDLFDFSNFDLWFRFESFVDLVKFSKSYSSFEFFIELFNFRSQAQFDDCINDWRPQLFSHDRSRFALVATRALRALFVRKILVKRQFTCSLYFGIIEL